MCGQDNLKQQKAYSALIGPTCQTIWNRYIIHEQNGERYEAAADSVFPKEKTKRSFLIINHVETSAPQSTSIFILRPISSKRIKLHTHEYPYQLHEHSKYPRLPKNSQNKILLILNIRHKHKSRRM